MLLPKEEAVFQYRKILTPACFRTQLHKCMSVRHTETWSLSGLKCQQKSKNLCGYFVATTEW